MLNMLKQLAVLLIFLPGILNAEPMATESTRRFDDPVFGGHLYVDEFGRFNRQKILLIHGVGDIAGRDWKNLAPFLSEKYHLIIPDLPGFGRSDKGNKQYSVQNYAELLQWLIRQYGKEPVTVIGHSMGGTIAIELAAEYPSLLDQLVIIDAAGILHRTLVTKHATRVGDEGLLRKLIKPAITGFNAITRGLINAVEMEQTPEELQRILHKKELRQQYLNGEPSKIASVSVVITDFSRSLPKVKAPSLVIWGSDDPVSPLRTAYLLTRNLPRARLEIIPYAGHGPINSQSRKTARAILAYLQNPAPTTRGTPHADTSSGNRDGKCKSNSGMKFSGHYNHISVQGCKKVLIENASIKSLDIRNSRVTIRNSIIGGNDTGIVLFNSHLHMDNSDVSGTETGINTKGAHLTVNGAKISGGIAILAQRSRMDLAGVFLDGNKAALQNLRGRAVIMFSASRSSSENGNHYLHGYHKVYRDEPL